MSDDTNAGEAGPQDTGRQAAPSTPGAPPPPPASATPPPAAAPPQYQQGPVPDTTGQIQYVVQSGGGGPSLNLTAGLVLALLAIIALALAIFIKESPGEGAPSVNLWDRLNGLWSIAAIAAAVATLLPSLRTVVNLDERRAWNIAAGAAGFLLFWWVVFILPILNFNVCFLATLAVAAAVLAVWMSPGNPYKRAAGTTTTP